MKKTDKAKEIKSNAQKKKIVAKFKNILAQPIPYYCPEISENDVEELKQLFIGIKPENDEKINLKNYGITLGLNECLRKLKTQKISSCLLSTEIKPKTILQQLIYMILTVYPETNVLCVPNLRMITQQIFNISSLILIIEKGISQSSSLSIENWIMKKCENYPIQQEFIQFYGGRKNTTKIYETTGITRKNHQEEQNSSKNTVQVDFNKLYLARPSNTTKRAFIPENAINFEPLNFKIENVVKKLIKPSSGWNEDYISFSKEISIDDKTNKNEHDNDDDDVIDLDSNEECEKDKACLLKVFETMMTTNTDKKTDEENVKMKDNEMVKEVDIPKDQAEILDDPVVEKKTEKIRIFDFINKFSDRSETIDSNKKKKSRKRKKNSTLKQSACKEIKLEEPVFKYVTLNVNKIQGNPNPNKKKKKSKKKK